MSNSSICANVGNEEWPTEWPQGNSLFGLALLIFNLTVTVVGVAMMYIRRDYQPVKNRQKGSIAFSAFGTWTVSTAVSLREYLGRDIFPCDLYLWAIMLAIPTVAGPIVVRLESLTNRIKWQKKIVDLAIESENEVDESGLSKSKFKAGRIYAYRALVLMMAFFMLIILAYFIVSDVYGNGCVGCDLTTTDSAFFAGMVVIVASFVIFQLYKIRKMKIRDDTHIIRELKLVAAGFAFGMSLWFVLHTTDPGNLHVNGVFSWSHVIVLSCTCFLLYQVVWLVMKSYDVDWSRLFMCKPQIGRSFRGTLEELLSDPEGFRIFEDFLRSEFSVENLRFWAVATQWRNGREKMLESEDLEHGVSTSSETKRLSNDIYRIFIKRNAVLEVNLHAATRSKLQKVFQPNYRESSQSSKTNGSVVIDDDVDITVFDEAIEEIFQLMAADSFRRFQVTPAYRSYAKGNSKNTTIKLLTSNVATAMGVAKDTRGMKKALTGSSAAILEDEPLI